MDDENTLLMVYCTCPDHDTALELANALVDGGLAGCVNIVPGLTSVYSWQGERQQGEEELLLIKTTRDSYLSLEAFISDWHPYELPEILAVPIETGLPTYLDWVAESCTVTTPGN